MSTQINRTFVTTALEGQQRALQQLTEQATLLEKQLQQCRASIVATGGAVQALEYVLEHKEPETAAEPANVIPITP